MMDFIGKVTPPPIFSDKPEADLGRILGRAINIALLIAGFLVLIFMLWGAYDWIASGGDKEKLAKAQQKITQAVIGIIITVAAMAIFGLITGDILGIIQRTDSGWVFTLPVVETGP